MEVLEAFGVFSIGIEKSLLRDEEFPAMQKRIVWIRL